MKLISEMIMEREGRYWMKEIYCNQPSCSEYRQKTTRPITEHMRCRNCGCTKKERYVEIPKPNYTEYFSKKNANKMKRKW